MLILDQFEVTLLDSPALVRQSFLTQLEQALNTTLPLAVIVVMRNDLLPVLPQYVPQSLLETWWTDENIFSLPTAIDRENLNDIVREPAAAVGLAFQDGLIESIVDNAIESAPTTGEPGRATQSAILPLLEHALDQLWQRRTERKPKKKRNGSANSKRRKTLLLRLSGGAKLKHWYAEKLRKEPKNGHG